MDLLVGKILLEGEETRLDSNQDFCSHLKGNYYRDWRKDSAGKST